MVANQALSIQRKLLDIYHGDLNVKAGQKTRTNKNILAHVMCWSVTNPMLATRNSPIFIWSGIELFKDVFSIIVNRQSGGPCCCWGLPSRHDRTLRDQQTADLWRKCLTVSTLLLEFESNYDLLNQFLLHNFQDVDIEVLLRDLDDGPSVALSWQTLIHPLLFIMWIVW